MEQAAILKSGIVVKITGLQFPSYSISGFLNSFYKENKQYRQTLKSDFREEDQWHKNAIGGFYEKDAFLKYLNKNEDYSIEKLNKYYFKFKLANNDDEINVKKLKLSPPYHSFCIIETYKWPYQNNIELVDYLTEQLIIPTGTNPNPIHGENFPLYSNTPKEFYHHKISLFVDPLIDSNEKQAKAFLFAKMAIRIHQIKKDIFQLFNTITNTDFEVYLNNQETQWSTQKIFNNPTIEILESYYEGLTNFYQNAYSNQILIQNASEKEKFYWLVKCLTPESLTIVPASDKIKLLEYITKNNLSSFFVEDDEMLVLKICASFDGSNLIEIKKFLDNLISIKPDVGSETTLYECIYKKMSTSTKIVAGVKSLSNYLVNTNYKPSNTKSQFVNSIYALWMVSEYNPFDLDGHYKPNTIGLSSLDNSLVEINSNINTSNFLYQYTNYYASDPVFEDYQNSGRNFHELKAYKETRPEAAPLIIPYFNKNLSDFLKVPYLPLDPFVSNFELDFSGELIKAKQKVTKWRRSQDINTNEPEEYIYQADIFAGDLDVPYGKYKIYQPVTLTNRDFESREYYAFSTGDDLVVNGNKINTLIPMFVLQFIHDDSGRSNAEDIIGFSVNVVSTATGFGSLSKLKHLRWAATGASEVGLFTINGIRIVIGGVEFSSGVLSFLGNFVECNSNDVICNGVKSFLNYLQLVCLAFNVVDGLASTLARNKANELINSADEIGSHDNSLDNLTEALGDTPEANTAATNIIEFAGESSQLSKIKEIVDQEYEILSKTLADKIKQSGGAFSPKRYKSEFTEPNLKNFIKEATELKIYSRKFAEDFIVMSCRPLKSYSYEETMIMLNYYAKVTLVKGFCTGFHNLDDYKLFCNNFKNFTENHFASLEIQIKEYDVQGSVLFLSHPNNPEGFTDIPVIKRGDPPVIKTPDDFDGRMVISPEDGKKVAEYLKRYWREKIPTLKKEDFDPGELEFIQTNINDIYIDKQLAKGMLNKTVLPLEYNSGLKNVVKNNGNDLFFPLNSKGYSEVGGAFIIKGSTYDILPFMKFKY